MIFRYPKEVLVASIVLFLAVLFIMNFNKHDDLVQYEIDKCRWSSEMKAKVVEGVVSNKIIDQKNHNNPTVLFSTYSKVEKILLTNELSGFYEFVMIGDSVRKEKGELNVLVIRNGGIIEKELSYGCAEEVGGN